MKRMFGLQMCQSLESRGWVLVRVSGVHHIYRHPTNQRYTIVPVRRSKPMKPTTQRHLARDLTPLVDEL
ncbi:type II toxin-antitoxin system HicA family toxin [Gemmata sp. JC717]|uniref:Type II toxin-antitoxin system HicA family toxin n=1 Tax=Gemmata algarum TaxID=2975278 RepID=A0ABU5F2D7_9BACT|nr:type II toxin-antitoxin system HicA family toxin [Gemmata algarum]MDY3556415.1 type II toxin-antitoxin system HicA family toxin [Gemmata algarum]MDY3560897.1 type II toxin-antitoxin system HicA family toxin [Gemmata algarum]